MIWRATASGRGQGRPRDGLGGRLYFGDYSGHVYALRRPTASSSGRSGTSGATDGLRFGQFYATAAVAFGRVYLGNTDGNVYSFAHDTGKLAWRDAHGRLRLLLGGRGEVPAA